MNCLRCHAETPADSRFCLQCGASQILTCVVCSAALPPETRFCNQCGYPLKPSSPFGTTSPESYTPHHLASKILTSRSALEGERKQVTVLFVDVSDFTVMSEKLDPEEVHGLMTRAFELMLAEVHRYEGTINQFLGDGIMALFGAPIAHEDHAQRAVHAALGIKSALEQYHDHLWRERQISFHVRQGLNTGLVVVGSIGNDLRMDYTAVGDTTNVAARLQALADRGRIVISAATHRQVADNLFTRLLGEFSLKGKTGSLQAWEVIAARTTRTRLEIQAMRGLTPFVGRDRELRLLFEQFQQANEGHGQVVFISGDPGIGKSRLLVEFRRQLADQVTWLEGHALSYGRSVPFHPLIDMLKRNFRVEDGDTGTDIGHKLERGVTLLGEDLRPIVPYLLYLLGVDTDRSELASLPPQHRRDQIFNALRRLIARAAEIRPQVLVIEDLQWMDQATEAFILHVVDSIPASRVLAILTYRASYAQPLGDRTYYTQTALTTLSAEHSLQMARAMLTADRLP